MVILDDIDQNVLFMSFGKILAQKRLENYICHFFQQCAKKLNWDTFNDKGLGLALYWYIDTFVSIKSEVNWRVIIIGVVWKPDDV